uniref:PSP proline-rich domain-containing protein n=1 Tax=Ditylenchus dipsaci TaxID=166011 RepID=A0A915CY69_9BILA
MKRKNIQTLVIELDESTEESIDEGGDLNSSDIVCTYQEDSSFIIDTEQCEEQENSAFMSSEAGSTLNMSNICSHLTPEVKKTKKGPACFNCQGEHQLIECTEPRDNRRISRNRSSFRSNQGGPRIHEQLDSTKKSFVPGVISDSLREALGLRKNEMPEWIFRMRVKGFIDGYPPAYLKRAVEKSTLEFFATDQVAGVDDVKAWRRLTLIK